MKCKFSKCKIYKYVKFNILSFSNVIPQITTVPSTFLKYQRTVLVLNVKFKYLNNRVKASQKRLAVNFLSGNGVDKST